MRGRCCALQITNSKLQRRREIRNRKSQIANDENSAFRNPQSAIERGIILGCFGGLIGFFTSGLVHYNLGDSEVAMVFYLLMGIKCFYL